MRKAKKLNPQHATYVAGYYTWRIKGGFFKRLIQPAIIECVDGKRINIEVRPYLDAKSVLAAIKGLEHYYDHEMSAEAKAYDKTPLKPKRDLPARFVLPAKNAGPPKADVTLTPYEALVLGTQLMDFAKREKAKRPCPDCQTTGRLYNKGVKIKCRPCKGKGFLAPKKP